LSFNMLGSDRCGVGASLIKAVRRSIYESPKQVRGRGRRSGDPSSAVSGLGTSEHGLGVGYP